MFFFHYLRSRKFHCFHKGLCPPNILISLIRESLCRFCSLFITVRVFKQLIKNYNFLVFEVVFWYYSLLTRVYIFQLRHGKCMSFCHSQKFVPKISLIFSSRNFQVLNESSIVVKLGSRNIYMKNLYF